MPSYREPVKSSNSLKLKISDIPEKYPKQWVTVDITQRDEYGWPVEGRVILHSKTRDDMVDKLKNIEGDLYVLYSGSIDDDVN